MTQNRGPLSVTRILRMFDDTGAGCFSQRLLCTVSAMCTANANNRTSSSTRNSARSIDQTRHPHTDGLNPAARLRHSVLAVHVAPLPHERVHRPHKNDNRSRPQQVQHRVVLLLCSHLFHRKTHAFYTLLRETGKMRWTDSNPRTSSSFLVKPSLGQDEAVRKGRVHSKQDEVFPLECIG